MCFYHYYSLCLQADGVLRGCGIWSGDSSNEVVVEKGLARRVTLLMISISSSTDKTLHFSRSRNHKLLCISCLRSNSRRDEWRQSTREDGKTFFFIDIEILYVGSYTFDRVLFPLAANIVFNFDVVAFLISSESFFFFGFCRKNREERKEDKRELESQRAGRICVNEDRWISMRK